MKRSHLFSVLCVLCTCASCSDDSSVVRDDTETVACTNKSDCTDGKVCVSGECVKPGSLGDTCESDDSCNERYICHNGKCANAVTKGKECDGVRDVCIEPNQCQNGICSTIIAQGESCTPNSKTDVCETGFKCVQRKCSKVAEEGSDCTSDVTICDAGMTCKDGVCTKIDAESCQSDDNCPDSQPTCLPNGVCGIYVDRSQECDDETRICKDGLECAFTCFQMSTPDGFCDYEDNIFCPEGYYCSENQCQQVRFDLKRGDSCNADFRYCEKPFVCENGFCNEYVNETDACDESKHIYCKGDDIICYKNVCTPISGNCTSSSECTEKDSYCCTADTCGNATGKCVTYDNDVTYDAECKYKTKPGIFEAQIQCRWQPAADDYPKAKAAEMPPLVGHFGNKDNVNTTVVILSTPNRDSSEGNVLRVINAETCKTLESIPGTNGFYKPSWENYPSAADLDGDGFLEIIAATKSRVLQAWKWNPNTQKHEVYWTAKESSYGNYLVFDVNGDGKPEIVVGTRVLNGQTGATICSGNLYTTKTFAIGYFDNDQYASIVTDNGVQKWNEKDKAWDTLFTIDKYVANHVGYADFGTPGDTEKDFDFNTLDGKPEFVFAGNNSLRIYAAKSENGTYKPQKIMEVGNFALGGPVTIGDFDNDGYPEIAVASKNAFGVYDPRCSGYDNPKGCADVSVLWERWSQDVSSGVTGSSLFDFDGDGQPEAVYGDECFVRVYEGNTGRVLFSAKRSSYTSYEAPTIADVDDDGSAEILMTSDRPYRSCYDDTTPPGWTEVDGDSESIKYKSRNSIDPIHEGIRCIANEDCPTSKNCNTTVGLCTCETDADCNTQYIKRDGKDVLFEQYKCAAPIHTNVGFLTYDATTQKRIQKVYKGTRPNGWKEGDYKVCRASRKLTDYGNEDLVIYKDRLDRWVSSRNIWNQHAYNIINIEDDGKVPTPTAWWINWIKEKIDQYVNGSTTQKRREYNSYRLNKQGLYGAGTVPDITGRFEVGSICGKTYTKHDDLTCSKDTDCEDNRVCQDGVCADMRYVISGKLCNRGTKPVSMNLPASFYFYDETKTDKRGQRICTSYTKTPVGIGKCDKVGCEVTKEVFDSLTGKDVLMITNENEHGFRSTDECNYNNNNDRITIKECAENIDIVN